MSNPSSSTPPPEPVAAVSASPAASADVTLQLRLTVSRGALGLELAEAAALGPFRVLELGLTFPGLRYPIDLSGGVSQFRHRRGTLERVVVEFQPQVLASWLAVGLCELLGTLERPPRVQATAERLEFGFNGETAALAFDLVWAPEGDEVRFVLDRVRGIGLSGPALGYAMRALDAVSASFGERRGRTLHFEKGVRQLMRSWLPRGGVRVPECDQVALGQAALGPSGSFVLTADSSGEPLKLGAAGLRAIERAQFLGGADDLLAQGDLQAARIAYTRLLDEAPRHPDVAAAIAEIDGFSAAVPEAALGMLREFGHNWEPSPIVASLLAQASEKEAARQAYQAFARAETFAPLAALAQLEAARVAPDARARHESLDAAVALCPSLVRLRWHRLEERIRSGQISAAVSDAEQIEAMTLGATARCQVCLRVGRNMRGQDRSEEAARFFERALRYVPDDIDATAGLARALSSVGRPERAIKLLMRAVTLSEKRGQPDAEACVDLALLLAAELHDLPQAIARVRQVTHESGQLLHARFLEASWRAELGDLAGAAAAYDRFRESAELASAPGPLTATWLLQAASFADEIMGDSASAERSLLVGLRFFPHDEPLNQEYQRFGRKRLLSE